MGTRDALPPFPDNRNKRRKIHAIDGRELTLVIEDEIVRHQANARHPKLIYLQRVRFEEDGRIEYRLTYYMLGQKAGARGKWVFGQYSLLVPPADFAALLGEARHRGWVKASNIPVNTDALPARSARWQRAGYRARVCRAWHRTDGVQVPVPGISGAEG